MERHYSILWSFKLPQSCFFFLMSQKNTSDTQLRKTESKTVQVICRVGLCVKDVILFYSSVNLAQFFSENELSHSDNEEERHIFFFLEEVEGGHLPVWSVGRCWRKLAPSIPWRGSYKKTSGSTVTMDSAGKTGSCKKKVPGLLNLIKKNFF